MSMNLYVYAGPMLEIKPEGPIKTQADMSEFAYEKLNEALWSPSTGDNLYFLPNWNSLSERSYNWNKYEETAPNLINPNQEEDKLWFENSIKPFISKLPEGTQYEVVWGVISYYN